ncbi:hypothetical protein VF21_05556 [Pseudogymnoascus sp. 05NY08]|nr:hypothetical protein VF21_05556 [Pseudogymnoascus sp. 05NY08]
MGPSRPNLRGTDVPKPSSNLPVVHTHRDISQHNMMLRPRNPPPNAKRQRLNTELILSKGYDIPETAVAAEEIDDSEPSQISCDNDNLDQAWSPLVSNSQSATGDKYEIKDSDEDSDDALSHHSLHPQAAVADQKIHHGICKGPQAPSAILEIPDSEYDSSDALSVNSAQATDVSHSYPFPSRRPRPTDVDGDNDDGSIVEYDGEVSLSEDEEASLSENEEEHEPVVDDEEEGSVFEDDGDVPPSEEEDSFFNVLNENEDAFDDALMGDKSDDFVPGPDYDDDDKFNREPKNGKKSSSFIAKVVAEYNANALSALYPAQQMSGTEYERRVKCFEHRILLLVEGMKRHAQAIKYNSNRTNSTYPLSFSMWTLLRQASMDSLMAAFMAAISDKVKVALGGATIDDNAILSVDRDWLHYQAGGVYVNLALDKSTGKYGCYVGSTRRHFHIRIKRHLKIAAPYTPDTLPLYHGGSKHYNYVCKANISPNFRILAVFRDKDVPAGYVYLLEAIMMILLQTIPPPSNGNNWHNPDAHNVVKELQASTDVSVGRWAQLNIAWPAVQGFCMDRASCENENEETEHARGEGKPKEAH